MRARDAERKATRQDFIQTLRRVADALEHNQPFRIQVAGQRFTVPANALLSIEHEVEGDLSELELQLRWNVTEADDDDDDHN